MSFWSKLCRCKESKIDQPIESPAPAMDSPVATAEPETDQPDTSEEPRADQSQDSLAPETQPTIEIEEPFRQSD